MKSQLFTAEQVSKLLCDGCRCNMPSIVDPFDRGSKNRVHIVNGLKKVCGASDWMKVPKIKKPAPVTQDDGFVSIPNEITYTLEQVCRMLCEGCAYDLAVIHGAEDNPPLEYSHKYNGGSIPCAAQDWINASAK